MPGWGLLDRIHTEPRTCSLAWRIDAGQGCNLGPRLVPTVRMAAIQHGSTATHPDAGGRAGTREDGDLHGWTRVDVLTPGMQEVSGSSPLSSTPDQRPFSRSRGRAFLVLRGTLRDKIVAPRCGVPHRGLPVGIGKLLVPLIVRRQAQKEMPANVEALNRRVEARQPQHPA